MPNVNRKGDEGSVFADPLDIFLGQLSAAGDFRDNLPVVVSEL